MEKTKANYPSMEGGSSEQAATTTPCYCYYCAATVSVTGSDPSLPFVSEDATADALRKKTAAEVGTCEIVPEATIASVVSTLAKPDAASCDHCVDLPAAEPIESVHACVALTVMTRPFVAGWTEETLVAV